MRGTREAFVRAIRGTQRRYDRNAALFDFGESLVERMAFARWRRLLWSRVAAGRVLEVGVGTGKNMPYYPAGATVMAVDLSLGMLRRAVRKAREAKTPVGLAQMTAEALAFPSETYDWVVATFVFCSVADPVAGFRELARVCKPNGTILLLEHVRIDRPVIGRLMDIVNPLAVRLTGANINRRTVENVRSAGLSLVRVESLSRTGLVKLITARPQSSP